jgi:hypothetical protein
MVAVTKLVATLITDTVLSPEFATYTKLKDTGVAVMVAVIGLLPVFTAMKEGISPVPVAESPMPGVLFTQLYTQPVPGKLIALVGLPLETVWVPWAVAA